MAIITQTITDKYALYNADCVEVLTQLPKGKVDFSIFSPPFADLYCYSDSPMDLGNCKTYDEFFIHFGFVVEQLARVIKPGRNCAVHCMDIPAMKERDGQRVDAAKAAAAVTMFCSTVQQGVLRAAQEEDQTGQWPPEIRESFENATRRILLRVEQAGQDCLRSLRGNAAQSS